MLAAIPFPAWIKPEIIPGLPLLRWYGLMYVIAFGISYVLFKWQTRNRLEEFDPDTATSFFFWGISGLLIGARLFGTLVYDRSGIYWMKPWLIFWPFSEGCQFTGLMGMSYHGGLVGCIIGTMIYAKRKKLDFLKWTDLIVAGIPFGFTFGRLGNFINGELYGRVTTLPWGMIFPDAERFSAKESWVLPMAQKTGVSVESMVSEVNLPRHPSQLYEALFEGLVLGLILWFVVRKLKPFRGLLLGSYIVGFGFFRFFIEYFREPDYKVGYVINLSGMDLNSEVAKASGTIARFITPWAFSMGQIFCFLMMLGGGIFLYIMAKRSKAPLLADDAADRLRSQRKLRRRLR